MTGETIERPVLGIRTLFVSDSADVLAIVEEAFGGWACLEQREYESIEPVRVRIVVVDGDEGTTGRAAVRHYCPDADRVIARSAGSVGVSDPMRREATAYVTRALVADGAHFQETFLEALTFALLSHFDRHPIHAAAIARGGRAVLLAGRSGAGKSTLAHLAHQSGITVLGDDHVWIQRTRILRVWGSPGRVRLLPNPPRSEPGRKAVIRLDDALRDPASYAADHAAVCLLGRGDEAALDRVDGATIIDALTSHVDPGFDRFPARHHSVVKELARDGGWRLTLSANPNDALPFLRAMLDPR